VQKLFSEVMTLTKRREEEFTVKGIVDNLWKGENGL
jgi:hypothetical protein